MNHTLKAIIIALVLIVVGAVLAGCGLLGLNGAWDQFAGKNTMITNQETITDGFTNLDIDIFWLDTELLPSPDGTCYYQAVTYESMPCNITVENGTLKVCQQDNRKFYEHIGIYWNPMILKLYLPTEAYENLTFDGDTSDLTIPAYFQFHSVIVNNSTGDIDFSAQVTETLNLSCSTGDIVLYGAAAKDINISVSSGDIRLDNISCNSLSAISRTGEKHFTNVTCGSLQSKASTGDLKITDVMVSGNAVITANTGDVKFNGFDASSISISTTTGDVKGTLLSDKIFLVDTSTGHIDVPKSISGGTCNITTSTGDIEIQITS